MLLFLIVLIIAEGKTTILLNKPMLKEWDNMDNIQISNRKKENLPAIVYGWFAKREILLFSYF